MKIDWIWDLQLDLRRLSSNIMNHLWCMFDTKAYIIRDKMSKRPGLCSVPQQEKLYHQFDVKCIVWLKKTPKWLSLFLTNEKNNPKQILISCLFAQLSWLSNQSSDPLTGARFNWLYVEWWEVAVSQWSYLESGAAQMTELKKIYININTN